MRIIEKKGPGVHSSPSVKNQDLTPYFILARYLAQNPDKVAEVVSGTSTGVPVEIRTLGARSDVRNVIGKNDQGPILNKTAVQELAGELLPYAV